MILSPSLKGAEMTRRKVRDHIDATELLDALKASGQSLPDFCRARGLDGRSLNCWRLNFQRDAAPARRGLRLVEVAVVRPSVRSTGSWSTGSRSRSTTTFATTRSRGSWRW